MQDRTDTPATALWAAAYAGDCATVERLLAEGVDVNLWDPQGRSALTFAACAGHMQIVQVLIQAGAWIDPHEEGDVYLTPLMGAAQLGHIQIVEFLLEKGADPTRHGGYCLATAEYYARADNPKKFVLAAILRKAEDQWRVVHRP